MTLTNRGVPPVPVYRVFYRSPQERHMVWIIDRLEGAYAVCENARRETRDIAIADLPAGVKPGDALRHNAKGWSVDEEETLKRRNEAVALTKDLWA